MISTETASGVLKVSSFVVSYCMSKEASHPVHILTEPECRAQRTSIFVSPLKVISDLFEKQIA